MNQFLYAGYVLPGVANALSASGTEDENVLSILRQRFCSTAAEIASPGGKPPPADPVVATAANIVSRGLPTFPSYEIQQAFDRAIGLTRSSVDDRGRIRGTLASPDRSVGDRFHAALAAAQTALSPKRKKADTPADGDHVLETLLRESGAEVTALLFSPLLMARIQRALLHLLLKAVLDLSADRWRITIIERDVPAAALAIADLRALFDALFALEGKGRSVPDITLTVLPSKAFADSPLHRHADATIAKDARHLPASDCCIDAAILSFPGAVHPEIPSDTAVHVTLRTAGDEGGAREFMAVEAVPWAPIVDAGAPDRSDAAVHLLRRLFRLDAFREQQLPLLDLALRQRPMLVSLPAGSGKSLIYHFAALLQPARSLIIEPLSSLAIDQEQSLRDCLIDGVACLHESLAAEQRRQEIASMKRGEVFCTVMTAELFRDEECITVLQELRNANVFFSQCVIDEAHTLSEWSHDSRCTMYGAAEAAAQRLRGGKKAVVPLRLFTSAIARDVIEDLRRQCAAAGRAGRLSDGEIVVERKSLHSATHYSVYPSPVGNSAPRELLRGKRAAIDSLLQRLPAFFDELQSTVPLSSRLPDFRPDTFFSRETGYAGVLYCPRPSGVLGVTSKFSPAGGDYTVAEKLERDDLRIGVFVGKEEGVSHVGRQVLEEAAAERSRLRAGDINLLVATGAFGIGIDNPRIRYTVHLTPPPSIERFVQESGRAGHDGRSALAAVLFAPDGASRSADAAIATETQAIATSSAAREKQQLHDLLHEISYPEDSNTGRVANMIEDEFGINVRVSYWQRGLDERMYVYEAGNACGYVDLVTQDVVTESAVHDAEFARSILQFAHDVSLAEAGSGPTLSSWVSATFPSDVDDGIAQQMVEFDPDATFTLRIGFENDREPLLNRIHQLLWHDADIQIQRKLLSQASAQSWTDFCSQLEMRSRKIGAFEALDADLEQRLIALFNKIRTRADTERVIQRLAMLGAVQDYTINASARKFSLTMHVRHDNEYRESLRAYMGTFVPEAHVERLLAGLSSYPGDSELERCLYFLVDFTYQQPIRRRQEAVAIMLHACEVGAGEGAAAFRHELDFSLRAKYARRDRLPRDLKSAADRFAVLQTYLGLIEEDASGSMFENAEHLERSCIELGQAGGNDPLLDALASFARLLMCRNDQRIPALRAQFVDAVTECAAASGISGSRYLEAVTPLFQLFRRYFSQELTSQLRTELENAADRIRKSVPRSMPTLTGTAGDDVPGAMHDLTAAPVSPPARDDTPASRAAEKSGGTDAERRTEGTGRVDRKRESRAPRRADTEHERRPAERPEAEEKHSETPESETDIEAILADLERTLAGDQDTPSEKPPRRHKDPATDSASKEAPGEDRKRVSERESPSGKSRAAGKKSSAELSAAAKQKPSAEKAARRKYTARKSAATRSAEKHDPGETDPGATVDPAVDQALTWLQTFNNRFLKDYESRNARIPAGS